MNDTIFCQLNIIIMRRKRTCQRCTLRAERRDTRGYCREGTPQDASCSQYLELLPSIPASGVVVAALLLLGCRFIHIATPGSYIIARVWRGSFFICCLRLLVAHTYQAILVLLPKLTNAPTNRGVARGGAHGARAPPLLPKIVENEFTRLREREARCTR